MTGAWDNEGTAYGGSRPESWGHWGTGEHSWYHHECKPGQGCWVGCGPIHRDDDPRVGDCCASCGVEYGHTEHQSLGECEG